MVFLAITPAGFEQALRLKGVPGLAIWCGAGAVSEVEFDRSEGINLTRLDDDLRDLSPGAIQGALSTIGEHHPGEIVWVEGMWAR